MNHTSMKTLLLVSAVGCALSTSAFAKSIKCPTSTEIANLFPPKSEIKNCTYSGTFKDFTATCTFIPTSDKVNDTDWVVSSGTNFTVDHPTYDFQQGDFTIERYHNNPISTEKVEDSLQCIYTFIPTDPNSHMQGRFTVTVSQDYSGAETKCSRKSFPDRRIGFECN